MKLSALRRLIREEIQRSLTEAPRKAQAVSVWVFYPGSLYGTDRGEKLEKTISATAKKFGMSEEGSGLGGDRDMSFFSKDPAKAKAFAAAVKKLAGVKKVEVHDDLAEGKRPLKEAPYDLSMNPRRDFAKSGSALRAASRQNPRNLPCPTCGQPNRLTPKDKRMGYQCDSCANAEEGNF